MKTSTITQSGEVLKTSSSKGTNSGSVEEVKVERPSQTYLEMKRAREKAREESSRKSSDSQESDMEFNEEEALKKYNSSKYGISDQAHLSLMKDIFHLKKDAKFNRYGLTGHDFSI